MLRVVIARLLTLNSVKATAQEEESEGEAETNVAGHEEAKLEACSPRVPNVAIPGARSNLGKNRLDCAVQSFLGLTSAIDVDSWRLRDDLNTLRQELEV